MPGNGRDGDNRCLTIERVRVVAKYIISKAKRI